MFNKSSWYSHIKTKKLEHLKTLEEVKEEVKEEIKEQTLKSILLCLPAWCALSSQVSYLA
jgi:hypothetical protein